jgi:hypothetical protein
MVLEMGLNKKEALLQTENGFILILTVLAIIMITTATLIIAERTANASIFSARRAVSVQAYSLAESGALEGYWRLVQNPDLRTNGTAYWGSDYYSYTIIDATPGSVGDLSLTVRGEGFQNGVSSATVVELSLTRPSTTALFTINAWHEYRTP